MKKIAFVGTVNAMPMMYAKKFKAAGYDTIYVVDVSADNKLSRPEAHFPDVQYPYEKWVKELLIKRPSLKSVLPRIFFRKIINQVSCRDVYFLCDWYISIAPFLSQKATVIILPHGADLDTWCNESKADQIARSGKFSFFFPLKKIIAKIIINNMRKGLSRADAITYFPEKFNEDGDLVLREFDGKKIFRRYDVDLSLVNLSNHEKEGDLLTICSAVRFDYIDKNDSGNKYLKGNDVIIRGISKYYREHSKKIRVLFFNKGRDLMEAKRLCVDEGIADVVEWKDTVPLRELIDIYNRSDICFDQVGRHWMGAVGVYALLANKPLIANYRPEILDGQLKGINPILQASTVDQVFNNLLRLSDPVERLCVGSKGREFASNNFDADNLFHEYVNYIENN